MYDNLVESAQKARAGLFLLPVAGMLLVASSVRAEPVGLDMATMDGITAGTAADHSLMPRDFSLSPVILRTQQITTRVTMPVANAIAICLLCAPGASANATSIAMGDAQADSIATAMGAARSDVVSTAVGLHWISPELLASLVAAVPSP